MLHDILLFCCPYMYNVWADGLGCTCTAASQPQEVRVSLVVASHYAGHGWLAGHHDTMHGI